MGIVGKVWGIVGLAIVASLASILVPSKMIASLVVLVCVVVMATLAWSIQKRLKNATSNLEEGTILQAEDEISHLYQEIMAYEDSQSKSCDNDLLYSEINEVLKKVEKGLFSYKIETRTDNPELSQLIHTLNHMVESINEDFQQAIDILIEYGKANFVYGVNTKGLSGKTGSVILGIEALGASISELLAIISLTSSKLNEEMQNLSEASTALATASNQQAASLEETAAALEEITGTIINNTENTQKMSDYAKEVSVSVKEGQTMATQTTESMDEINKQVNAIHEAITVIDQIAFQTNILSLNAAVEAATAGEAGKGFAVVAAEVRNLASRSAEAAKEIKDIVETATSKANDGKTIADKMIHGYIELNKNIESTIETINEVSSASKEQRTGIEQINDAITELDQTTQQNASAASQISSQSDSIKQLSDNLLAIIEQTQFDKKALEQVCDIDLMFNLNSLKLDHIKFKDTQYDELGTYKNWTVKTCHECNLGKWIDTQEKANKSFTKNQNWERLKKFHFDVHNGVQTIIHDNAQHKVEEILSRAVNVDEAVMEVFKCIQQTKIDNCDEVKF